MSADNFLCVSPVGDKWWITDQSASSDYLTPVSQSGWKLGPFDTKEMALLAAFEAEQKDYYEYGTSVCETEIPVTHIKCGVCAGTGQQNGTNCSVCEGSGWVPIDEEPDFRTLTDDFYQSGGTLEW